MKKELLSLHGKQEIKDEYLQRLRLHYDADEIIKGTYWQNGKGCAVGCTVHSSNHLSYETELGISIILAKLEDRIFEGLPNDKAKEFPIQFLSAIPVGINLEMVWRKLMIWILTDEVNGVIKFAKTEKTKQSILEVSEAFSNSLVNEVPLEKWNEIRKNTAYSAAAAAYSAAAADAADAADAAAYSADAAAYSAAAAAYSAADAADAADADAAAAAAYAAADAADAAAAAAYAAAYSAAAAAAARKKYYVAMSEKLIELLKETKA